MKKAPIPENEKQRLAALYSLKILDTAPEERFDRISRLASHLFDVPMVQLSLVDEHRQWFKSKVGLDAEETERDISFCGHTIMGDDPFVVPDARVDERFSDNPLVTGEPNVCLYAGYPITGPDDQKIGAFCIVDNKPRDLTEDELALLKDFAAIVENEINTVLVADLQQELSESNERLQSSRERFRNLFQKSNDAVFLHDMDGQIIDVNQRAEALFGYSNEEFRKLTVPDLHTPEVYGEAKEKSRRFVEEGSASFEIDFRKKNGDTFLASLSATIIETDGEKIVQGIVRDISAERRAMEEIARRMAEKEALLEASVAISSTLDLPSLLNTMARTVCKALHATSAYVLDVDSEAGIETVVAEYVSEEADEKEKVSDLGESYTLDTDLTRDRVILNRGEPFTSHVDDPTLPEGDRSHMIEYGCQSDLIIPMEVGGEMTCYVEVWESRRKREFTTEEISLAAGIAQHGATAMEHAKLLELTQKEVQERENAEAELRKTYQNLLERSERLERFQRVTVGRELQMIEMKKEIDGLLQEAGRPPRYKKSKAELQDE